MHLDHLGVTTLHFKLVQRPGLSLTGSRDVNPVPSWAL